jgi:fido (protein-threonine AMPylation protein)
MHTLYTGRRFAEVTEESVADIARSLEGVDFMDTDGYKQQGEPDRETREYCWQTGIGLQNADGLTPTRRLLEIANANIEGTITMDEAERLVDEHYSMKDSLIEKGDRKEEADKSATRIAQLLKSDTLSFRPIELSCIHSNQFRDIFKFAGEFRSSNLAKDEWILRGDSVKYTHWEEIPGTLAFNFSEEAKFNYIGLELRQKVEHIAQFIAGLWQIHPFAEGNTRTIAVFTIRHLRNFGFKVTNNAFKDNAWYFRNSLVRASFSDNIRGIPKNTDYLNRFFRRLLFNDDIELRNSDLLIAAPDQRPSP